MDTKNTYNSLVASIAIIVVAVVAIIFGRKVELRDGPRQFKTEKI